MDIVLEGQRITKVRRMTKREMNDEGWEAGRHGAPTVLVLEDGTRLYPSRDDEGNGSGALFGKTKAGEGFTL